MYSSVAKHSDSPQNVRYFFSKIFVSHVSLFRRIFIFFNLKFWEIRTRESLPYFIITLKQYSRRRIIDATCRYYKYWEIRRKQEGSMIDFPLACRYSPLSVLMATLSPFSKTLTAAMQLIVNAVHLDRFRWCIWTNVRKEDACVLFRIKEIDNNNISQYR